MELSSVDKVRIEVKATNKGGKWICTYPCTNMMKVGDEAYDCRKLFNLTAPVYLCSMDCVHRLIAEWNK